MFCPHAGKSRAAAVKRVAVAACCSLRCRKARFARAGGREAGASGSAPAVSYSVSTAVSVPGAIILTFHMQYLPDVVALYAHQKSTADAPLLLTVAKT